MSSTSESGGMALARIRGGLMLLILRMDAWLLSIGWKRLEGWMQTRLVALSVLQMMRWLLQLHRRRGWKWHGDQRS